MDDQKLKQLITLTKNKDKAAFGEIYDFYYSKIFNYSLRKVRNQHAAEDIVSNSFFKILSSIQSFKWECLEKFNGWIYKITLNEINEYFRSQNKYKFIPEENLELFFISNEKNEIDEKLDLDLNLKNILSKMDNLKPIYQEIIHLRFFEELKFKEISIVLDMNESTIKVYFNRALAELKTYFN